MLDEHAVLQRCADSSFMQLNPILFFGKVPKLKEENEMSTLRYPSARQGCRMTGQAFEVLISEGTERDLEALLFDYLAEHGTVPRELQSLGMREYRQLYFKPYRVIYRIIEQRVDIYQIADGRRDRLALLSRRLLG